MWPLSSSVRCMKTAGLIAIGSATTLLSACTTFPFPHRANVTPDVVGVIEQGTQTFPARSASVCESERGRCCTGRFSAEAPLRNGSFNVSALRETRFFVSMMAHRRFYWCLALRSEDSEYLVGPFSDYALVDSGPVGIGNVSCGFQEGAWSCAEVVNGERVAPNYSLKRTDQSLRD
jgi:hypothetical protein